MPHKLLHNCLFEHDVARHFQTLNFRLPMLGWCNDEHFHVLDDINMCLTYICKLSCDACGNDSNDLLSYYNNYVCSTLNVQQGRRIKMDDVYIYHVHTLSLLLACLQNKHRRGRLYFQEREDDVDMVISDSTNITSREHVYQVNSSKSCIIYYSITRDKNTSPILVSGKMMMRWRRGRLQVKKGRMMSTSLL